MTDEFPDRFRFFFREKAVLFHFVEEQIKRIVRLLLEGMDDPSFLVAHPINSLARGIRVGLVEFFRVIQQIRLVLFLLFLLPVVALRGVLSRAGGRFSPARSNPSPAR